LSPHESKAEQADDRAPTSDPTVASLVRLIESAESVVQQAEAIVAKDPVVATNGQESLGSASDQPSIALPDVEPARRSPQLPRVPSSDSDESPLAQAPSRRGSLGSDHERLSITLTDVAPAKSSQPVRRASSSDSDETPLSVAPSLHSSLGSDRDKPPIAQSSLEPAKSSPQERRVASSESDSDSDSDSDSEEISVSVVPRRHGPLQNDRERRPIDPSDLEVARSSPHRRREPASGSGEFAIDVEEEHQPAPRSGGHVARRRPLTLARFVSGVGAPLTDICALLLAAISTTLDATGLGPAFIVGVVGVVIAGLRAIAEDVKKHEEDPRTWGKRLLHTVGALTPSLMTIPMGIAGTTYGASTMNVGAAVWIPFVFGLIAIFIVHFIKLIKWVDRS
jgi:hypothetical protein